MPLLQLLRQHRRNKPPRPRAGLQAQPDLGDA